MKPTVGKLPVINAKKKQKVQEMPDLNSLADLTRQIEKQAAKIEIVPKAPVHLVMTPIYALRHIASKMSGLITEWPWDIIQEGMQCSSTILTGTGYQQLTLFAESFELYHMKKSTIFTADPKEFVNAIQSESDSSIMELLYDEEGDGENVNMMFKEDGIILNQQLKLIVTLATTYSEFPKPDYDVHMRIQSKCLLNLIKRVTKRKPNTIEFKVTHDKLLLTGDGDGGKSQAEISAVGEVQFDLRNSGNKAPQKKKKAETEDGDVLDKVVMVRLLHDKSCSAIFSASYLTKLLFDDVSDYIDLCMNSNVMRIKYDLMQSKSSRKVVGEWLIMIVAKLEEQNDVDKGYVMDLPEAKLDDASVMIELGDSSNSAEEDIPKEELGTEDTANDTSVETGTTEETTVNDVLDELIHDEVEQVNDPVAAPAKSLFKPFKKKPNFKQK